MVIRITLTICALALLVALCCLRPAKIGTTAFAQVGSAAALITPPEIVLQTGHSKSVKALVFGPENKWVATGAFDNTIRIWDTSAGHELRSLTGHSGAINTLVRNRDGTILASLGNDNTIRMWDVPSGKEIRKFDVRGRSTSLIALSPDGGSLALNGPDNSVEMRDSRTGDQLWDGGAHTAAWTAAAFSPDGSSLMLGTIDGSIRILDAKTGKTLKTLKGHSNAVRSIKFGLAGQTLASSSDDGTLRQWNFASAREISRSSLSPKAPLDIAYSPTYALLIVDQDRLVRTNTGARGAKFGDLAKCADLNGVTEAGSFSGDGQLVGFGNGDGTVSICDVSTGRPLTTLENHTVGSYDAAISPGQKYVASAGFDNSVKLWDLQTGQNLPALKGHTGRVTAVAFRPETDQVISGSVDKTVRIWNVLTREPSIVLNGHSDTVQSLAVSRSGKLLVSSSSDQTIGVWDLRAPQSPPRFLKDHRGEVTSVDISVDEDRVVSGGSDGKLRVWSLQTGTVIRSIDTGAGIHAVAFSPDGRRIASGGSDGKIRVWNSADLESLSLLVGHAGSVYSVSFSADGERVASAGLDKSSRVWAVADGRELAILQGHDGIVYSAVFSPDQRFILTSSDDGSLIVWPSDKTSPLARLITLKLGNEWLVVTENGFFDGSPGAWERLSWRFDKSTFSVSPIEIFFSEYFMPGLLAETLDRGSEPPGISITAKDRRQPHLKVTAGTSTGQTSPRTIKITIDAADAGAGVRDVRLFRNGLLVRAWRGSVLKGQRVEKLEADVPIVAGENVFSAYAFNLDNIKSRDSRIIVTGDGSLSRRGVLHILTVGLNEYANSDFDLNYAVADATDIGAEFMKRQADINFYERVDVIQLSDAQATKRAILEALGSLASRLQPEDGLLIYFAGHGIANKDRFYLIPHDLGYTGSRDNLRSSGLHEILRSSISDQELEKAFELIDADRITFVIDACNSGQVLETEDRRQGPMNSKGLAQLAYEKGMYVLTAAQSYQAAKEASRLGHGFLTFALVEEGLRKNGADRDPRDGQILLREWLDFAMTRVPQINEEAITERKLEREKNKNVRVLGRNDLQRPRVFYRRESESRPFVVARSVQVTGTTK